MSRGRVAKGHSIELNLFVLLLHEEFNDQLSDWPRQSILNPTTNCSLPSILMNGKVKITVPTSAKWNTPSRVATPPESNQWWELQSRSLFMLWILTDQLTSMSPTLLEDENRERTMTFSSILGGSNTISRELHKGRSLPLTRPPTVRYRLEPR